MSEHLGFGHGLIDVEGGAMPNLGLWLAWIVVSASVSRLMLSWHYGHFTSKEEKFTSCANSYKELCLQEDKLEEAVSTVEGSL